MADISNTVSRVLETLKNQKWQDDVVDLYNMMSDDFSPTIFHMDDIDTFINQWDILPHDLIDMVQRSPNFMLDDDFGFYDTEHGKMISFNSMFDEQLREYININAFAFDLANSSLQAIEDMEKYYGKCDLLTKIKQIILED